MISVSRTPILYTLLALVLLATVPAAILRIVQTGDLYLFSDQFFGHMLARLSGPGRLRFILQPCTAILLGIRDGRRDSARGLPPFLWALVYHGEHRWQMFRGAFVSLRDLVALAILLDVLSQFLIFRRVYPGAAILLGPVLIGLPYANARAFANRIVSKFFASRVT